MVESSGRIAGAGSSVSVYYCGYEECESGHFWGPALRSQYLLHYVIEGKGEYSVNGNSYSIGKNECFLIRPGELAVYTADKDKPWTYMWIAFDGFDVPDILRRIGLSKHYVAYIDRGKEFEGFLHRLIDEFDKGNDLMVLSCFFGTMSLLESSAQEKAFSPEDEYIIKAVSYLKSNFAYPIRIGELARHIGIDRTYLYRIFSASEGISPKQYLMQLRISAAKKMLLSGIYSVSETALSCGFADSASFCGKFKAETGKTPKEFAAEDKKNHHTVSK